MPLPNPQLQIRIQNNSDWTWNALTPFPAMLPFLPFQAPDQAVYVCYMMNTQIPYNGLTYLGLPIGTSTSPLPTILPDGWTSSLVVLRDGLWTLTVAYGDGTGTSSSLQYRCRDGESWHLERCMDCNLHTRCSMEVVAPEGDGM